MCQCLGQFFGRSACAAVWRRFVSLGLTLAGLSVAVTVSQMPPPSSHVDIMLTRYDYLIRLP
eukprot:4675849-Alexandrium_andersonii.AAC.1